MPDKEIDDYLQWFNTEYQHKGETIPHLGALKYYDKNIYDKVFKIAAYDFVDQRYNYSQLPHPIEGGACKSSS